MEIFDLLQDATPFTVMALLAYVIYLLVRSKSAITSVRDNHLHEITDVLRDIQGELRKANEGITYIRARINGKGRD